MLSDTLTAIADNTTDDSTRNILLSLIPYIPALKNASQEVVSNVINSMVQQDWQTADALVWEHLSEDERDKLNDSILKDARDAVDKAYERNELAKQVALKVALSLVLGAIAII